VGKDCACELCRWHRASRLNPAEDGVAHAVEEVRRFAVALRRRLALAALLCGVSALERLILNQR
jgi:hypothetical protein